jgi:hypothetical protein
MSTQTDDMAMFYQQLADARKAGAREERDRIIKLFESQDLVAWFGLNKAAVLLIKGEIETPTPETSPFCGCGCGDLYGEQSHE